MLLPALHDPPHTTALHFADGTLTHAQLRDAAAALAARLADAPPGRVAVYATAELATAVAVVGALAAGRTVVPVSPSSGEGELAHIASDSEPALVLAADPAPGALSALERIDPLAPGRSPTTLADEPGDDAPAFVVYTSGTTGPPKGVVLTRGAVAANLDALAEIWGWTSADTVVHALPLFHVHGLIVGVLGPLRLGGTARHVGRFTPEAIAAALSDGGTMLFGVPTMYHRLAAAAQEDDAVARALGGARLLVSGSAALAAALHERLQRLTGQVVVERYGMSETLMITSIRPGGSPQPGYVGTPLPGVEVQVRDEDGDPTPADDATVGAVWVRGPSLFSGYLGNDEATRAAFDADGWFATGDLGCASPDGTLRLVGRSSTDLIKSGGYRIGAGEIESALLSHDAVEEAAVLGEPDDDLGERIVAYVVLSGEVDDDALIAHVGEQLSKHKRPREVRRVDALPRNAMGKVVKKELRGL